jgi:hypothetical protein
MMLIPKEERIRSPRHLAFIRSLPCLYPGCGRSPCDAAHVSYSDPDHGKTGRGMGSKESDNWTVPLCHDHHMLQHAMPEREFWSTIGIDPCNIATALWQCTGDLDAGRLIINAGDTQ